VSSLLPSLNFTTNITLKTKVMENIPFCPICHAVEDNPGTQEIKVCAECTQKILSEYTCYSCEDPRKCIFAFDEYNKNGDCITIK
jgi:hypothetical protein